MLFMAHNTTKPFLLSLVQMVGLCSESFAVEEETEG